jgi:hypothetical protein
MRATSDLEIAEVTDEPIVGWRTWHLSPTAPRLLPAGAGVGSDTWEPGVASTARCGLNRLLSIGRPGHESPGERCRCGIYAHRSLEDFARDTVPAYPPSSVVGTVSLWGRVIEHERGWRAARAYPARLRLVCVLCAWVEPGPGTPAVVHTFDGHASTLCLEHREGIELPDGRRTAPTGIDPALLQARLLDAYAVDLLPAERVEPLVHRPAAEAPPAFFPVIRPVRVP